MQRTFCNKLKCVLKEITSLRFKGNNIVTWLFSTHRVDNQQKNVWTLILQLKIVMKDNILLIDARWVFTLKRLGRLSKLTYDELS